MADIASKGNGSSIGLPSKTGFKLTQSLMGIVDFLKRGFQEIPEMNVG